MDKLASRDTENEASRETEIGLLAEAFREKPRVRRRLRQDAETSYARLEARRRAWWARTWLVRGPRLTF
jgi:hypothetical protein